MNKMNIKKKLVAFVSTVVLMALVVVCLGMVLVKACSGTDEWKEARMESVVGSAAKDSVHVVHYTRPEIPQVMTEPADRAAYYVKHYWDGYLVDDTAWVNGMDTEQLYADFIDALKYAEPEASLTGLYAMMVRMEADSTAYKRFCLLGEKYLYEPNSPMRNEDYYIAVLEQMVVSGRLTEWEKIRPADRLRQARKNQPGMKAADFAYVTPKGESGRMSGLKAEYTLLFFYDPDCSNCRKFEKVFEEMPAFVEMVEEGTLCVLAVYPDENEEEWLVKSAHMPRGWIVGWNKAGDIRNRQLYDIHATPSLYLLDLRKRVILKDASMDQLIGYLATRDAKKK